MRMEYMQEFLALRTYMNFTTAAEKLFITQSALSRHIASMEKELGCTLLLRDTHHVSLTKEGEEAAEVFAQILGLYQGYTAHLQQIRNGFVGQLPLGVLYYTINSDLGRILPSFQADYPNVLIKTYSMQPQEVFRGLMSGKIDLGIMTEAAHPEFFSLSFQKILQADAVAMLSRKHPLAERETLHLEDLRDESVLMLRADPYTSYSTIEALGRCGFKPASLVETDHTDTVPFALMKSDCVYITAGGYQIPGFEEEITIIPIEEKNLYYIKSFAWRKDNKNPVVPLFLSFAGRQCG